MPILLSDVLRGRPVLSFRILLLRQSLLQFYFLGFYFFRFNWLGKNSSLAVTTPLSCLPNCYGGPYPLLPLFSA